MPILQANVLCVHSNDEKNPQTAGEQEQFLLSSPSALKEKADVSMDVCSLDRDLTRANSESGDTGGGIPTHTTICLRPSRGLRMNLRVRRVTGASLSAMVAVLCCLSLRE